MQGADNRGCSIAIGDDATRMLLDNVSPVCSVYNTQLPVSLVVPAEVRAKIVVLSTRGDPNGNQDDELGCRLLEFKGVDQFVHGPVEKSFTISWSKVVTSLAVRPKKQKGEAEAAPKKKKGDDDPILFSVGLRDADQ